MLSAALTKLMHRDQFRHNIQDYRIISSMWDRRLYLSLILSFVIPVGEMLTGLGLISGSFLFIGIILAISLLSIFSCTMVFNLAQGRDNLSCHCGGALGDHKISWWLVGRNLSLIAIVGVLLITPTDQLTLDTFLREPTLFRDVLFTTIFPLLLVIIVILVIFRLLRYANILMRGDH